ncbi:putative methyltransferase-domain-containing protein [Suillus clintonianus]|uniref:putative methyltransferase-domain-containing protein n=1 Tax=Suillus clintonianus TaxID=1904413 RepID=UPI001B8859AF|nr:putative methyltransferase-domain-containing protein [Suillus clintonianus]KAG2121871.1 putative methyltransferase-domain-containing protein [Suillus clintonianus]
MFYYISFLRPPPTQAALSGEPIHITPQIANDLRTEYYTDVQDIFYSWALQSPTPSSSVITKPVKLTSWRASTMYKEIPVPPPRNACNGEYWRLILSSGTSRKDQVLSLNDENLGHRPFPVLSDPILFSTRPSKVVKQERIRRSYALTETNKDHPTIFHIIEQTSFDLDKKIWDSGIGLSSWLVQLHFGMVSNTALVSKAKNALFASKCAGTGIVAIVLGILRGLLDSPVSSGKIITTDLPSALPLLQSNINSSRSLYHPGNAPEGAVLDWDEPDISTQVASFVSGIDVIVMADVTYNTASFPALIGTLSWLIRFSMNIAPTKPPLIILGYKERDVAERTLWEMAEKIGIRFEEVAQVPGAEGTPVEVWVGTVSVNTQ